jgi:hypothetical protein
MNQTLEVTERKEVLEFDNESEIALSAAWASFGECARKLAADIGWFAVVRKEK